MITIGTLTLLLLLLVPLFIPVFLMTSFYDINTMLDGELVLNCIYLFPLK